MQMLDIEEKEIVLVGDTNCDYKRLIHQNSN